MDARLPWHQRLAVRLHLLYCIWCRRYVAQVRILREAARKLGAAAADTSAPRLSQEAKEQIRKRLQEAVTPPPSPPS